MIQITLIPFSISLPSNSSKPFPTSTSKNLCRPMSSCSTLHLTMSSILGMGHRLHDWTDTRCSLSSWSIIRELICGKGTQDYQSRSEEVPGFKFKDHWEITGFEGRELYMLLAEERESIQEFMLIPFARRRGKNRSMVLLCIPRAELLLRCKTLVTHLTVTCGETLCFHWS